MIVPDLMCLDTITYNFCFMKNPQPITMLQILCISARLRTFIMSQIERFF